MSSQCERLDDVRTATESAVHNDGEPLSDGACDFRQHIDRGDAAVQLSASVVREHDAVAPQSRGALRVGDAQYTCYQQLSRPVAANPGDVIPADRGLEQVGDDRAATNGARRTGRKE